MPDPARGARTLVLGVWGLGFRGSGFRASGFRGLGFRVLNFLSPKGAKPWLYRGHIGVKFGVMLGICFLSPWS